VVRNRNGLYFSVVTFATLGYGDIAPLGKILAVVEVLLRYLMGGLLIAILAGKVLGD
jgi:voltage-gated potassium channel Kch